MNDVIIFAKKYLDKKRMLHCAKVYKNCMRLNTAGRLDNKVFLIAAYIHDIGKIDNDIYHHIFSLKYFFEYLDANLEYDDISYSVIDCILHHRKHSTPATEYGRIFQKADKM